ncbi:hypothetical protein GNG27_09460 [Leclercia sp. 119287]|uniref:hypothetical protein n=1 Tax=Leclercia sp. 119287 TaxID=2681308 RepID=UPI0012E12AA8|nr:hypothetical protein [Leclercia sp. 119287]QGU14877.1 hypothetical protein GNG27_09460 [Leclercia sp. 119287]
MKDLYLRFADADEMRAQLIEAGFAVDEEQGILYHPDICLDVVGIITTNIGEGESLEYIAEPGYHVNLRVINDDLDLSPLDEFAVSPKTPTRVWA